MERTKRVAAVASLLVLAACTEQDAAGFERAVDSFFVSILQFFLVMMLIAAFFFVLWAFIFAGAATALIAGIKRVRDRKVDAVPLPPAEQPAALPQNGTPSPSPAATRSKGDPDWLGVGMIIFGVVLLLAAAPTVFSVNLGPTSAGSVTIPMPLILGGAALIWFATRRNKKAPAEPPAQRADDQTP